MADTILLFRELPPHSPPGPAYRLADRRLITECQLSGLEPFKVCSDVGQAQVSGPDSVIAWETGGESYTVAGWIGGETRTFRCRIAPQGRRLDIEGMGSCWIAANGSSAVWRGSAVDMSENLLTEAVLAAMVQALALQNVFCLHASAVTVHDAAVAFIAESGSGKSTLAAFLDSDRGNDWLRMADDALPAELSSSTPHVLPHFPQLKLPPEAQWPLAKPGRVALKAIYCLEPVPPASSRPQIQPLSRKAATLALIQQTHAARLFDARLLQAHLDFCAQVAARIPVKRLIYPHDHALLPRVRDVIQADLES
jgi:hypothetical protein